MPHFDVEFHNIIVLYQNFRNTKYNYKQKTSLYKNTDNLYVINIQDILLNHFEND